MAPVVGIDLGTTNSVIAIIQGGDPVVIPNTEGSRLTPSVVAFTKAGERLVGQTAKRQAILNTERTIASIKRQMGTKHRVKIDDKDYSPEEISAMILQKLKADAEAYLGDKVSQAVVTVPAYFDDAQRTATKTAGEIAGLEVLRIINEPTAAALAYGLDKKKDETILVWDLGGGTFDVSLLDVGEGVFEVKSTSGDTRLGGDDWDQALVDYLADAFKKDQGIDLRSDRQALQRLREAAEKAKVELSQVTQTTINLPFITADQHGPKHLDLTITRAKFEDLTAALLKRCEGPFRQAIGDAKLSVEDLDEVILVGGATRMPMVQELVKRLTGKEPHRGVNPDEVVAVGAAIQAGILGGQVREVVLLDVTPLSLGIETLGGVCTKLIERNTTIPTRKSESFTTAADGQTEVEVHVLQGERAMAKDNRSLGKFHLTGIPPAPRGIPKVEVTFDLDVNGILSVTAKDTATGREQAIRITGSAQLAPDEVEKMRRASEEFAEQDKQVRELAEARNQADSLVYQMERMLKEHEAKIVESDRAEVQRGIEAVREAVKGEDVAAIRRAADDLQKTSFRISEALYRDAAAAGAPADAPAGGDATPPPDGEAGGDGGVIDAEFRKTD